MEPRTSVITGATGDIGRAVATRLAARGDRVVLVGRNAESLEAVAREIGRGALVVGDVTDAGWLDALDAVAPEVSVVVHAASAHAPIAPIEATTAEDAARVYATGPGAALSLVGAVLPGMKERAFGRIVLIGSLADSLEGRGHAAHAAANAALIGLARSVAIEGGERGVTANVVELGLVDTARLRTYVKAEDFAALVRATPVGRAGTPAEIAAVVAFLCSEEAAFVTGTVVQATGGLGLGLPRSNG